MTSKRGSSGRRPRGAPAYLVTYYIRRAMFPCGLLLAVCYTFGFLASDYFRLREVAISGTNAGLVEEVAGYIQAPARANTVFYRVGLLAKDAERFPRVRSARAERDLPGRVVVRLEPRHPAFCLAADGKYVMVDAEGVLLFFTDHPGPAYPRVHGDGTTEIVLGGRLKEDCLATVLQCMEGATQAGLDANFDLDLSSRFCYMLFTPAGTPVRLGAADNMVRKVIIAATIEQSIAAQGERAEYIDVRVVTKPKYRRDVQAAALPPGTS